MGANPENQILQISGIRTGGILVHSVFCFFILQGKTDKCSQKPGLVNQFSATPRGQLLGPALLQTVLTNSLIIIVVGLSFFLAIAREEWN